MNTFKPTIPDVEAGTDVLRDVADMSDSLTPTEAVEFRVAVERVLAECRLTIDLLNMQIIKTLEQDVVRDGRRFYVGRKKESERFDHDAICGAILSHVADLPDMVDTEGDGAFAAREAVHAMRNIYLSDSTKAKVGQLDRYGIPRDRDDPASVRSWTPGEKIVVDIPAGGRDE